MVFLLFIDNIFGFILSICLLLLYFRVYTSELKNKKENKKEGESSNSSESESHKEHNKEHKHNHGNKSNETCEKCVMNMANINADKKIPIPSQASSSGSAGSSGSPGKPTNNKGDSLVPYITEENLLAAQTNIVNPLEYNKETHGVDKGIYNEEVYGSQGLDTKNIHIRGYDTNNIYLGSLSYDIL
jgi:hypothetical protein